MVQLMGDVTGNVNIVVIASGNVNIVGGHQIEVRSRIEYCKPL